jgi:hypothetical protein
VKNGMNEERFCVALVDDEVGFGGKEVQGKRREVVAAMAEAGKGCEFFKDAKNFLLDFERDGPSGLRGEVGDGLIDVVDCRRGEAVENSLPAGGSAVCQDAAGFLGGVGFATGGLRHALFEALIDGVLVLEEPVLLGLEEGDGAGDDLGRLAVVAEIDLTLDALLGGGVEG